MKSYKETLNFLYSQLPMFQRLGKIAIKKNLTNIIKLCDYLGNPQNKFKSIHVAGTNGKGSVSHILASIFHKHGYKTGLYTSPHYKDFRERIKVDGVYISEINVRIFLDKIEPVLKSIGPSFFEITVAMAFWYFAEKKCDITIIETGLGGRLDSTNILNPVLSIITNIGYDHQSMLGNTLQEIAVEKAGIIKENIPVLIGEKQEEVRDVFKAKAKKEISDIHFASDLISVTKLSSNLQTSRFQASNLINKKFEVDLSGPFVERNLKTSLGALILLSRNLPGFYLQSSMIVDALSKIKKLTNYLGRWHILSLPGQKPIIIADSAHNREGLTIAFDEISRLTYKKLHIITGFVMEKDLDSIIDLFPSKAHYYFAKADIPRGMNVDELTATFQKNGRNGRAYVSVKNAYNAALRKAGTEDLVLVIGSIFVIAEIL